MICIRSCPEKSICRINGNRMGDWLIMGRAVGLCLFDSIVEVYCLRIYWLAVQ